MINDITSDSEDGMKKAVESFKRDLQKIRTGRANTSMLDGIKVDCLGTFSITTNFVGSRSKTSAVSADSK